MSVCTCIGVNPLPNKHSLYKTGQYYHKYHTNHMFSGEAVEQEVRLSDGVETVREFTYLGDRVSAGVG